MAEPNNRSTANNTYGSRLRRKKHNEQENNDRSMRRVRGDNANPDSGNKALYDSVLSRQMMVIGTPQLRDQITSAADSSKPLMLHGYVFDRISPYFMVSSTSNIN